MEIRRNRVLLKVASFRPPSAGLPRFFHLIKVNATNERTEHESVREYLTEECRQFGSVSWGIHILC